jgi:hypothetical protein
MSSSVAPSLLNEDLARLTAFGIMAEVLSQAAGRELAAAKTALVSIAMKGSREEFKLVERVFAAFPVLRGA